MLAGAPSPRTLFAGLTPQAPDAVLSLIAAFRDDPRPGKIDLGVGVYRDEDGATPVLRAVKAAEAILLETQASKAYLGPEGDLEFLERLAPLIFGPGDVGRGFLSIQTPGGTGALRVAADLASAGSLGARIWLGVPTWPNHPSMFAQAGLQVMTYRHFDPATQTVRFDELMSALEQARAGDLVLLHGCCHNPTGVDLTRDQWRTVAARLAERGLTPLIDLAYQGLGEGLEDDAAGLRIVLDAVDTAMVAYSCDKNFGLYRERTGALFVRAPGCAEVVRSNMLFMARCAWSMPPDHGAAAVRTILGSETLSAQWRAELEAMRRRLVSVRAALSGAAPHLAALRRQHGMFSLLPISPDQVERLRREHGVYMAGSGRINLAGLTAATVPTFVKALDACLLGEPA